MPYNPPAHTPFQWQDAPSTNTPLDSANLETAENDLVSYTQTVATGLDTYLEGILAPQASPTFTGTPTAPTAPPLTNSTQLATTAYADSAVAAVQSKDLHVISSSNPTSGPVSMNNNELTGLAYAVNPQDAVNLDTAQTRFSRSSYPPIQFGRLQYDVGGTTVASGSNGVDVTTFSNGTLNVASVPTHISNAIAQSSISTAYVIVQTNSTVGVAVLSYTGTSGGNQLTGVNLVLGSGTISTGNAVGQTISTVDAVQRGISIIALQSLIADATSDTHNVTAADVMTVRAMRQLHDVTPAQCKMVYYLAAYESTGQPYGQTQFLRPANNQAGYYLYDDTGAKYTRNFAGGNAQMDIGNPEWQAAAAARAVTMANGAGYDGIFHDNVLINALTNNYADHLPMSTLTTLSANLSTASAITSISVNALSSPGFAQNEYFTLSDNNGHSQTWQASAAAAPGATTISVYSQIPNFSYPSTTTNVRGGYFGTLSASLNPSGGAITSLSVNALGSPIVGGTYFWLVDFATGTRQQWKASATATVGATTVSVVSQTPNFAYAAGAQLRGTFTSDFEYGYAMQSWLSYLKNQFSLNGLTCLIGNVGNMPTNNIGIPNGPVSPLTVAKAYVDAGLDVFYDESFYSGFSNSSSVFYPATISTSYANNFFAVAKHVTGRGKTYMAHSYVQTPPVSAVLQGAGLPLSGAVTSIPVAALANTLQNGTYTIQDPTGQYTDTFTSTGTNSAGNTSITITSHTFNYAYPAGSQITGSVSQNILLGSIAAAALCGDGRFCYLTDNCSDANVHANIGLGYGYTSGRHAAPWQQIYDKVRTVGSPLGDPYQTRNGLWKRKFANADIIVNNQNSSAVDYELGISVPQHGAQIIERTRTYRRYIGTANDVLPPGVYRAMARAGGGGGGSGGTSGTASVQAGGAGGTAGGYTDQLFTVTQLTPITVTIGAAGGGGASTTAGGVTGNSGSAGGDSSIVNATTTIAAGSNGVDVTTLTGTQTLSVASTTTFFGATYTGGVINVVTTNGTATIDYTNTSGGNTFTGCTTLSGTGTVATGNAVTQGDTVGVYAKGGRGGAGGVQNSNTIGASVPWGCNNAVTSSAVPGAGTGGNNSGPIGGNPLGYTGGGGGAGGPSTTTNGGGGGSAGTGPGTSGGGAAGASGTSGTVSGSNGAAASVNTGAGGGGGGGGTNNTGTGGAGGNGGTGFVEIIQMGPWPIT